MSSGVFVTFEGLDGSGKTTQIETLAKYLARRGRGVRVFREPGGTELGEKIRELILDDHDVVPWAEASLFAAARAQLVERAIRPALAAGDDVICDRFMDSSIAYQGFARELGESVREWNARVTGGLTPDRTFLLTLSAEDVSNRIAKRTSLVGDDDDRPPPDRLERESVLFRRRVEEGYRLLAADNPDRFVEVDAKLSRREVASLVRKHVDALIETALHAR